MTCRRKSQPCYLSLLSEDPRLSALKSIFYQRFQSIYVFPHRRNFTLVGCNADVPKSAVSLSSENTLSQTDTLMKKMNYIRWVHASREQQNESRNVPIEFQFSDVRQYFSDADLQRCVFELARDLIEIRAAILNGKNHSNLPHNDLLLRSRDIQKRNNEKFIKYILPLIGSWVASFEYAPSELIIKFQEILNLFESGSR